MCGIFCEIYNCSECVHNNEKVIQRIMNRGPDSVASTQLVNEDLNIYFLGAVLWMQGTIPYKQPVQDNNGILLYNGDIFDETWDSGQSDTQIIMEKLSNSNTSKDILETLQSLKGPFSLIYYHQSTQDLYFARDRIGRSSLLFYKDGNSTVISSVLGKEYNCIEVPATYIYRLCLNSMSVTQYSWDNNEDILNKLSVEDWLSNIQMQQNRSDEEFTLNSELYTDLNGEMEIIDYIESIAEKNTCKLTTMMKIMQESTIKHIVVFLTDLLEKSVRIRLETQPNKCKNCLNSEQLSCSHSVIGILFSGGLDCTILALLADKYVPKDQSIDLINVAFSTEPNPTFDVPDRLTGKQSYNELKRICCKRKWIFREVNVRKSKLEEAQKTIIADLVYPRRTVLDESLGSALWFAASAQDEESVSPCRVLLLGSGADELFGGYTRHRNAFKRHGWHGLAKELQLDWQRISFRNLARDNRVICDHGRQPRMPYLDEDFANFVLKLKPWFKCFPSKHLESGIGDKLMLRLVAMHLGLSEAVILPKRALQFGSRIANKKQKGNDLSKNLINISI